MKKITFTSLILFLSSTIFTFSQELNNPIQGIMAGSNANYLIQFYSGETIKGKILSITKEDIQIKPINRPTANFKKNEIKKVELIPFGSVGSAGIGIGVPYGVFGFNVEINTVDKLYITAGIGTAVFISDPMFNVGLKYYLKTSDNMWRPRLSAYYGNNGILFVEDYNGYDNFENKYTDFSFGIGQMFAFGFDKRHGFDLDIIYIANKELVDDYEMLKDQGVKFNLNATGHIKISFGYRLNF